MINFLFYNKNTVRSSTDVKARRFDGIVCLAEAARWVSLVFSAVSVLSVVALSLANDALALYKEEKSAYIEISELESLPEELAEKGIIEHPWLFSIYLEMKGAYDNGVKTRGAGVNSQMDYRKLLSSFTDPENESVVRITFERGAATEEIIDILVSNGLGSREGFEKTINEYPFEYGFVSGIKWNAEGTNERKYRLDGYLYPDTYDFYTGRSEAYYIYRMLDRFADVSESIVPLMNGEEYTFDEIVVIASLVQSSTARVAQYESISEVIHNRLKASEKFPFLEIPASNAYADGKKGVFYEVPSEELKSIASPYNTYEREGLPPGAICNPDINALICACRPSGSGFVYFVTLPSGETLFAITESEHRENLKIAADRLGKKTRE